MTTRELIEMASLDALGLLENEERDAFERAFRAASPAVQRQVRREQSRLASSEALLPDVDPPSSLRDRVVLAVHDAMRGVAAREGGDVLARLAPAGVAMRMNVSPLWRAACIGFATATIVLLAAGYNIQQEWSRAAHAQQDGDLAALIAQQFGSEYNDLFTSPNVKRMAFVPAADSPAASPNSSAAIYFDAETGKALLFVTRLPVFPGQYRLAVVDADGRVVREMEGFAYTGGVGGRPLRNLAFTPGEALAIYPPQSDDPLMVTLGV